MAWLVCYRIPFLVCFLTTEGAELGTEVTELIRTGEKHNALKIDGSLYVIRAVNIISIFFPHPPSHPQQQHAQHQGGLAQQVAVAGIKSGAVGGWYGLFDGGGRPPILRLVHRAGRVNETANAGIGAAHHPAAVFDGPQAGIGQVLAVAGGIAPPSVVGDDGHEVGALRPVAAHVFAVDAFVADGRRQPVAAAGVHGVALRLPGIAARGAAKFFKHRPQEKEEAGQGLHPGHQHALVVKLPGPAAVEQHAAVVGFVPLPRVGDGAGIGRDFFIEQPVALNAGKELQSRMPLQEGKQGSEEEILPQQRFVEPVGGIEGCFGPYQQGGIAVNLFFAEADEFLQLCFKAAGGHFFVRVNIGLHHHHVGCCGRIGRRYGGLQPAADNEREGDDQQGDEAQ